MNTKAIFTLLSLIAGAVSLAPAAALAERDNGINRDRQQQTQSEQRNNRKDANRQQAERPAPQRVQQNKQPRVERSNQPRAGQPAATRVQQNTPQRVQQNNRQRFERGTPQRTERPAPQRVERNAPPRVERKAYETRRTTAPERRHVETRRSFHVETPRVVERHVYRPVPRDRYYHGIHVYRHYGHRYPGFGFYYSDSDAFHWLAFTALTLAIIDQLDEHQQRMYEQAMIRATTADIGDTIYWQDSFSSGWVTVTDIWYDAHGRECRELEQSVTARGRTETRFSTVCRKPDGVWVVPAR